jgi:hypothetical protein
MKKVKFFDQEISVPKPDEVLPSGNQKTLNDVMVLRMLFLDHFFLFMGMNA